MKALLLGFAYWSCFSFCITAYSRRGQQNWFPQTTNYENNNNLNRQSRQVFVFPEGDSRRSSNSARNRQFGNNRGFNWGGTTSSNNRRRFPTQNDIRPVADDVNDVFVFDQNNDFGQNSAGANRPVSSSTQRIPTSTVAIPGMGTTRSACEDACLTTPEYNPVCGNDGLTYFSKARLRCAQRCGKRVDILHIGACPRTA